MPALDRGRRYAHLAATFRRFADQLDRARAGILDAPFRPDQLQAENLRAVRDFRADPCLNSPSKHTGSSVPSAAPMS